MLDRIYVEIGNICNLKCDFCPGTARAPRTMSTAEFRAVCEKIRGRCKSVFLHVMGEPLYHPQLSELLSISREYGLRISVTTNGTLLSTRGHVLLENADVLHRVSISMHAPEGNGAEVSSAYLDTAIAFAAELTRREVNAVFRLWNLDSDERQGENTQNAYVEDALRRAYDGEWEKRYSGYRIAYRTFLEYDGIFVWPSESTARGSDTGTCLALSRQAAILADGTVVPCCLDSDGLMPLGNIFESDLDGILSSDIATKMRLGFSQGNIVHPVCKKCTYRKRFD